jgi:2-polyprenyl-6-hydroxyphenyl methylase/3-demethylubiquinone-9 3-methyltransferase
MKQKEFRFGFGQNWQSFNKQLDEQRIAEAKTSLTAMLGAPRFDGKSFLDIGSGSGLFSLAMRQLGAKVYSFDYDVNSVQATAYLQKSFFENDQDWKVEQGSVLDNEYLSTLGTYDIVYSWGVLHHTGDMWTAFENVIPLVKPGGQLYIAIYNDLGPSSIRWRWIKKLYNQSLLGQILMTCICVPYFFMLTVFMSLKRGTNIFKTYRKNRGMSVYHDWIDWIGGYPYEFAKVKDVFLFFHAKGFDLSNIFTVSSIGCNEFVFRKENK